MEKKMLRAKQLGYDVEYFARDLISAFEELKKSYALININIEELIPRPFRDLDHLVLDSIYYYKDEVFIINFYLKDKSFFHYNVIFEDAWETNIFERDENGMINEIYTLVSSIGSEPKPPYLNLYGIGMAFTIDEFYKTYKNVKEVAQAMIQSQLWFNKASTPRDSVSYLETIAFEFKSLLNKKELLEKDVELFLNENLEILDVTLNIKSIITQPDLKILAGTFPHDLRPDLIGLDVSKKRWVILDYKKHNKSLVKNVDKVRTGLKSEVNDLENQLFEYRDYFDEEEHRKYFYEKYGVNIHKPYLIGLLGLIEENELKAFNRLMERKDKVFDLYPYNLLLDEFFRKINMIKRYSFKERSL